MGLSARAPKICVVGSSIMDLVTYAARLPALGETLPGTAFATAFGGKGANQAVMAAQLGAVVSMVSKLGSDTFGDDYLARLRSFDIDAEHVQRSASTATGVAAIGVDASGANAIIVVPGANDELSAADVASAASVITDADVVVCQWEIPLDAVASALRIARNAGVLTVFNPAPVRGALDDALCALVDVLCPNESEAEALTGHAIATVDDAEAAARSLSARGARTVVITLGERGALVVDAEGARVHTAPVVRAIDTTGAGDAFVAAMATMLAAGHAIDDAVRKAVEIASESVQHRGTQASYPDLRSAPPWR